MGRGEDCGGSWLVAVGANPFLAVAVAMDVDIRGPD